jgi:hypothetical protein
MGSSHFRCLSEEWVWEKNLPGEGFGMDMQLHGDELHKAGRDQTTLGNRAMKQEHPEREARAICHTTAGSHLEHILWREPEEAPQHSLST